MGSTVSNFVGLFDTLRIYFGLSASDVKKIIDLIPEFALQNRKNLIKKKINLIMKESGRDELYMKNFLKKHPDILMK